MGEREAAQAIFIAMFAQAELLEALLEEGALSERAARPLFGNILVVSNAWSHAYPEGQDLMSGVLLRLRTRLGVAENAGP